MKGSLGLAAALIFAGCRTPEAPPDALNSPTGKTAVRKDPTLVSGRFRIEFHDFRKDRSVDPDSRGVVSVTIQKSDPWAGEVTWTGEHWEGERIGWRLDGTRWTAWHYVQSKDLGKIDLVKFDTGLVLKEITPNQVVGTNRGEFRAHEVIVTKDDGNWDWLHIPLDPARAQDLAPKPPRKERGDSAEAAWILYQSDDLWLSRNLKLRRKAREGYQRLLSDFSYDESVVKNKDRIKARAEADIED